MGKWIIIKQTWSDQALDRFINLPKIISTAPSVKPLPSYIKVLYLQRCAIAAAVKSDFYGFNTLGGFAFDFLDMIP